MMRTVLITGGFGYLGGRIATEIARSGRWRVRLGSRVPRHTPTWLPDCEIVRADPRQPASLVEAATGAHAVIHLAAMNEHESVAFPDQAIEVNTTGTLHMLNAAIQAGVQRFVYFSTAHIYGAPLVGHITEQSLPRPVHPYAITHQAAEAFVLTAHDQRRLLGPVVRLSNGLGAPTHPDVDRWTLLVNDLCRQAVRDRKLVLRSSGQQQRDFITLHDVGRAALHFLEIDPDQVGDGIFNVGGGESLTVWAMTQRVAQACRDTLGFVPDIVRPEPPPNETSPPFRYDISKLEATGFRLNGDLDQEIAETLKICRAFTERTTV